MPELSILQLLRNDGWRIQSEPCWDGQVLLVGSRGPDRFSIRGVMGDVVGEFFRTAQTITQAQERRL